MPTLSNKHLVKPTQQALLVLLALMLFASCRKGTGRDDAMFHPTPDNIPAVTDPRFIIKDEPRDTLFWMQAALRGGHTVGVADGEPDDMIGRIGDVAVGDSLVYYVDGSYKHVRAYDFKGRLADIIGGPGSGPGEFGLVRKVSVTGTGDDLYVVVGSGEGRVSVFSKNRDGSHEFQNSFSAVASFLNGEMCAMHGHVYTTGYSDDLDGVIHKHTLEGEYVFSIGARYNSPHRIVRHTMAEGGSLECNTTHHTLLYTQPSAPIATAFTESGDLVWQVRFSDARMTRRPKVVIEDGNWGIFVAPPLVAGESWDIEILGGARGESFWLIRREIRSVERDRWMNHFYKVNVLSGQGEYLGVRPINSYLTGRIVRAIDQERLYSAQSTPYPQLGIHPVPNAAR